MSEVSNELLERLAVPHHGVYSHEPNPIFQGKYMQPHIIRFTPKERINDDGSRSIGMSFPALIACDFLAEPEKALQSVAELLNMVPAIAAELRAYRAERKFKLRDRVTKVKGSLWTGRVVGFYSTELTPVGYAVESDTERGSVQIYPEAALKLVEGEGEP